MCNNFGLRYVNVCMYDNVCILGCLIPVVVV